MAGPIWVVEHDDPDAAILVPSTTTRVFRLGLPYDRYTFHYISPTSWQLSDGTTELESSDFLDAPYVWYRRWKVAPPFPVVSVGIEWDVDARRFVERTWEAALVGALQAACAAAPDRWSRPPGRVDSKIETFRHLDGLGLLPPTVLGLACPDQADVPWVWKPLDVDQSVGGGRAAAFDVAPATSPTREPCPGIYQQRIEAVTELRVAYVFGEVAAVSAQEIAPTDFADKRFVDMTRAVYSTRALEASACRVAALTGLNMYTADILVDAAGRLWWIDVNPDGMFCAADSPDRHLLNLVQQRLRNLEKPDES